MTPEQQLELLRAHCVDLVSEEELLAKLRTGRPLRIKYGADPSAPDLHLGHSVPIRRLRQFQELGHTVVFIIGDFTGRIGDPSGKSKTRPMLTQEQVEANARSYAEQVGVLLDVERCELHYNSTWFETLGVDGMLRLASRYTVARMLERDDFSLRMKSEVPVALVELLYPLVQAYDSVAVRADVELGGTDQLFNFLVGRDIMRAYEMEPQVVVTWPLLVGTDGVDKMSKSLGNYVGITDAPGEMFGKLMSIPDSAMGMYYELLLDWTPAQVAQMDADIAAGRAHPRDLKAQLAESMVRLYHSAEAAQGARQEFASVFAQGQLPSDIPELPVPAGELENGRIWLVKLMTMGGLVASNGEGRRQIRQKAVSYEGTLILDEMAQVEVRGGEVLQVGKRRFARIVVP
jgi:tyrosyl-tRNA synthetase